MTATVTLYGDLELRTRLGPLAAHGGEFVNIAHDLDTFPGARESARLRAAGSAGAVRKLFSPAVLADERDRLALREMAAHGFQVRITAAPLPQGTVFVDRRTMILAESPGAAAATRRYTMSNAAALVNGAYALFEAAWEAAADLEAFLASDRPLLDDSARKVLRALGSGVTDAAAARQLGMSLRTYHRRVAELLAILGADSRFQAGIRAGELGLARD
ncbi:hypothetical protein O1R50_22885 [Glycomyces luteolus]|uniref:HTH luxR-type domain-containing protein n=1 Tax=Glycomyces luteolus TaxID=2670330 RepID=A0A9X3SSE9_9ACTN|nr:hypothetical protein [Glycomyces luteolus]MDA1362486.1 hypothetical protein [Glycomyces luteolus]